MLTFSMWNQLVIKMTPCQWCQSLNSMCNWGFDFSVINDSDSPPLLWQGCGVWRPSGPRNGDRAVDMQTASRTCSHLVVAYNDTPNNRHWFLLKSYSVLVAIATLGILHPASFPGIDNWFIDWLIFVCLIPLPIPMMIKLFVVKLGIPRGYNAHYSRQQGFVKESKYNRVIQIKENYEGLFECGYLRTCQIHWTVSNVHSSAVPWADVLH